MQTNKYNLILNTRIKGPDVFFRDLGFNKNQDKSVLYLLVTDEFFNSPEVNASFEKIQIPKNPVAENCISYSTNYYLMNFGSPLDIEIPLNIVLSTIGFKPFKHEQVKEEDKAFELTSYTSFGKGYGILGFNQTLLHLNYFLNCETLIAECFVPHNLVGYYESKLGFKEFDRTMVYKDRPKESGFGQEFVFTRDFEVATLKRPIFV
ncbi:hypothetical protein TBLA_0H03930 [Henningerozyma blattae CBS 6284]|uniref:N-acetyltransferase domain-containing protein n=1 Tax=Henningerozyma blattae (strain ATCC 34711 / CBS 6284 / DSM 70876 / NBRC 10599 / NRRL Y-10934 / UCD 77-7) TaxID=1071380 RepID=I2H8H2_HENB6|nr:hypothetical protein TBLA_0H03930 [Tetrapisispora blattae CBS 6284]CCH62674.1 hypothetical protein TBLA_0H03930 [Tetrapisispora blattae CBS 6284]